MENKNIVWFDLETTGINISQDRIIEICLIKTDSDLKEIEKFYSKVNPGSGIEIRPEAFEKHGITMESLRGEPSFSNIAQKVVDFIGDSDLGGYNALYFDIPMLTEELIRAGIVFNHRKHNVIDPFSIICKLEPRNLESVYSRYLGKDLTNAHSAEADIKATIEIFNHQKKNFQIPDNTNDIDLKFNDKRYENVDLAGKFKFKKINDREIIVFGFGKWIDTPFAEVYKKDPNYINWFITKGDFTMESKIIAKKLIERMKSMETSN